HRTLQVMRLCLTIASIIMTIIVLLIIRLTPSISGVYSKLLYLLIVTVELFDIYSQLIFDPQYIMPYLCVYRDSPMLNIPMSPAWGFIFWITMFALNVPIYSACFIHRHQLIIPPDSILKMSKHAQIATVFVIALPCLSYGYAYYISWDIGNEWIKKLLSDDWDKSVPEHMDCMFQYAELRNCWGASLFLASIIIASSISLHTFALIRKAQTLSPKTKSFHRMLLLALIAAAAVPMTFLVAPFASAMAYYLFFEKIFNYSDILLEGTLLSSCTAIFTNILALYFLQGTAQHKQTWANKFSAASNSSNVTIFPCLVRDISLFEISVKIKKWLRASLHRIRMFTGHSKLCGSALLSHPLLWR
ncbi:hypothetical protein PRIPAC_77415, partial [Pristionchus pacificus]